MIKGGTKVIVLSSSLKKKTGPREGSIGYVTQLDRPGRNIFYCEEENVFAHIAKVTFTRYGSETNKRRDETRFFLNILPSYLGENLSPKENSIDLDIAKVKNIEISSNSWRQLKATVVTGGYSDIHSGILVPLSPTKDNLLRFSVKEFKSWLNSLLMDNNFRRALHAIGNAPTKRLSHVIDLKQISMLEGMSIDRGYKDAVLDGASTTDRVLMIDTIRKLMSITYAQEYRQDTSNIKRWFIKTVWGRSSKSTTIAVLRTLITDFYSDTEFLWKMRMICGEDQAAKNMMLALPYFTEMKERLRCLAQALAVKSSNQNV